jgi:hypothetical protein
MLRIVNAKQKPEWGSAIPMRENGWLRNAAAKMVGRQAKSKYNGVIRDALKDML